MSMVQFLWKTVWWFLKKLKIEIPYILNLISGYISKKIESSFLNRYLHIPVHNNIIQSIQEVEATQMSINEWMDKPSMV